MTTLFIQQQLMLILCVLSPFLPKKPKNRVDFYFGKQFFFFKIVPGSNNSVAIDLICTHIRQKFQERSNRFRQKIAIPHRYLPSPSGISTSASRREDLNLTVLPQTNQLKVCFFLFKKNRYSFCPLIICLFSFPGNFHDPER